MIDITLLKKVIEENLEGSPLFLVDAKVKPGNAIEVEIDSELPVDIEACEKLTRKIEEVFDRDIEDYTLEVGSAGITSPFKVLRQYQKNIGKEVEVLTKEGKKISGLLKTVSPETFTIVSKEKIKTPESKRPILTEVEHTFGYNEVKSTKYILKF